MSRLYAAALATLILSLFAACTSSPDSRYEHSQDFAPLQSINAEQVADATPRADPIVLAGNKSPYEVRGVTYEVLQQYAGYREQGIASWYGAKFNGHQTSNGEIFDQYQPSAAHKTLPIPSYAKVTNLENGKTVVVRVNDRGPFHANRLIDLSYAAAVKLGYMEQGTARVEVEVISVAGVDDRRLSGDSYRFLQLGAFGAEASAQQLKLELQSFVAAPVFISPVQSQGNRLYRVRVGPVDTGKQLSALQQLLVDSGYDAGQPLP